MCSKGDTIQGKLVCKPNEHNHRDLDIDITFIHDAGETEQPVERAATYRMR